MSDAKCPQYTQLEAEVDEHLKKLSELTTLQLEIFRTKNYNSCMRLDKELELAVGKKERAIGALKEHAREHGCQRWIETKFSRSA